MFSPTSSIVHDSHTAWFNMLPHNTLVAPHKAYARVIMEIMLHATHLFSPSSIVHDSHTARFDMLPHNTHVAPHETCDYGDHAPRILV